MSFLAWILNNKFLIFLILASTAFGISTIILAVQKAELGIDLNTCRSESTTTEKPPRTTSTTTSTTTPSTSTKITTKEDTTITSSASTEKPTETTSETDSTITSSTDKQTETTPATVSSTMESTSPSTTVTTPEENADYRLPKHVVPISYNLTIEPNLNNGLFTGIVNIIVRVDEETKTIKLHSSNRLTISHVMLDQEVAKHELISKYELLVIGLEIDEIIPNGNHSIYVEFSGNMTDRIVGLYKSTYTDEDGKKRDIATSKFEPTYARQAFPCFDEPSFKATYTVHILKPTTGSYIALSNMPEVNETTRDEGVLVSFKESVPMSTYLTCFIVCDFISDNRTAVTTEGSVDLKVYATPAQIAKTKYAGYIAEEVIKYFVKYFDYKYPLPKLDLIAIPDFAAGAMEHWGLMTFREAALLYDEDISSTINKQIVATVVSHELAHSWFGNLVTMSWWNDLWLNEGFASYIQYKGVDAVEKDWQMMDQFLIETLHPVLSIDALSSTHPIIKTVVTPDQITEIFDTITYNKGASILRMLENAVTEEIFQEAVQKYLAKHAFENAVTQNLIDQLQLLLKDKVNVAEFIDTWTKQEGYPILTIKENQKDYMILEQKRFLKNSGEEIKSVDYSWTIPVTYITSVEKEKPQLQWFNHTEKSLKIMKPTGIEWFKFNLNQVGYYRFNYQPKQWNTLTNIIKTFKVSDRTHLLEESFSIAESGELSYEIPLNMTKYLKVEKEYIPWSVASTKLIQLNKYLNSSYYFDYLEYIKFIAQPRYDAVTWNEKEDEDHLTKLLRIRILELLCSVEHEDCLKEASERLDEWIKNKETPKVTNDLRSIIYKYGMVHANINKWKKMLKRFEQEVDANEKINILRGLAAVKSPELLKHLIELGKTEEVIRGQDYFGMLQYVSDNSVGTSIVWDYVRQNWENLVKRFSLTDGYLGKLIPAITSSFTTTMRLEEMKDFFEKYPEAGAGEAAREQALATVQANINWISKNKEEVEKWIFDNTKHDL